MEVDDAGDAPATPSRLVVTSGGDVSDADDALTLREAIVSAEASGQSAVVAFLGGAAGTEPRLAPHGHRALAAGSFVLQARFGQGARHDGDG